MADELKDTVMSQNFIHDFIDEDLAPGGQYEGMQVHTRFPPEPNGYLHIGHAKAIFVDFGTAAKYHGLCNLRMDDTNPTKEDVEFVDAIQEDIHWLGYEWAEFHYASDYFEQMYQYAVELIKKGLAYVCQLSAEEMSANRGDVNTPAVSPYRDRPIEDALEGITHSLCTLEFESHRPLYDWVVNNISIPYHKPRQIEFARLGIDHTVMSKRKLRQLVEQNYVSGWDDPRMPTICGLRRRGYTPAAIRAFSEQIGVAKSDSTVEYAFLEHCLRADLDDTAERVMAVIRPIKLTITNYPEGQSETFEIENHPKHPEMGTHTVTFSRELYIEAEDFLETPIPKYKRLYPDGPECRLKSAYLIRCTGCRKDENGNVVEVFAEYDPESKGGNPADGRKVKGATIHWVDAATALTAEVRLYDNLFSDAAPDAGGKDFLECLNPSSLEVLTDCKLEASLASAKAPASFQFMRQGYFCVDNKDSKPGHPVFNRSVSLKDSFKSKK